MNVEIQERTSQEITRSEPLTPRQELLKVVETRLLSPQALLLHYPLHRHRIRGRSIKFINIDSPDNSTHYLVAITKGDSAIGERVTGNRTRDHIEIKWVNTESNTHGYIQFVDNPFYPNDGFSSREAPVESNEERINDYIEWWKKRGGIDALSNRSPNNVSDKQIRHIAGQLAEGTVNSTLMNNAKRRLEETWDAFEAFNTDTAIIPNQAMQQIIAG